MGRDGHARASLKPPGERSSWGLPPIQPQLPQLRSQLGQVPHLDALVVHAHGQLATIRTEGERYDIRRQRQDGFKGVPIVKACVAKVRFRWVCRERKSRKPVSPAGVA